jgi:predicted nucleic acid-binding protein
LSTKVFLDTNIFVYCFDRRDPAKSDIASRLVQDALQSREGVVSYQVVQEFFNVALGKFAHPMSPADAQRYFTTVFHPMLAVHSSPALLTEALRIYDRYKQGWYDSLIISAAIEGGCQALCSEDMQHDLRIGDLRILNPFKIVDSESLR